MRLDARTVKSVANFPTLRVDDSESTINDGGPALEAFAAKLVAALVKYPHAVLLSGVRSDAGQDQAPDIVTLVRTIIAAMGGDPAWARLSFTEIEVIPDINADRGTATGYSRTSSGIAPHSDTSFLQEPDNLLALQCVHADTEGGETTIVPVEDVLERLSPESARELRRPVFPFADGVLKPVLSGRKGDECISYYDTQLEKGAAAHQTLLDEAGQSALLEIDQVISDPTIGFRFNLREGDLVLINNHKALHGRTALAEHSSRLLYRVRASVDFPSPRIVITQNYHKLMNKLFRRKAYFKITGQKSYEAGFIGHNGIFTRKAVAGIQELEEFADTMLNGGQFSLAVPAYEELLRRVPDNLPASKALSCLLEEQGETEKSELALKAAVEASPYQLEDKFSVELPVIIRTQGYKSRSRSVKRELNYYQANLSGGHFSLKHLLDTEKVNVIVKNLYDDSLSLAFPAPPFRLLINNIAVPERMGDALKVLIEFLKKYPDVPVINHPATVRMSTRENNYRRFSELDGIIFPQTFGFSFDGNAMEEILDRIENEGIEFPMILRPDNSHTGEGVALVEDKACFRAQLDTMGSGSYYAIAYYNLADKNGLYNKIRTFCIDGEYYPVANLHHDDWNVHSGNRYRVMNKDTYLQDKEKAYLTDMTSYVGRDNMERLERIREIMDLDFFGIDFTILPDGQLLIFECNAAMRHNFDHIESFPYTEPTLRNITDAFNTMVHRRLASSTG
ncbi:MAG: hypothetical protein HOB98_23730 [Gammaproteobacteria bacterium]|nr:hypothetical protein [Gammaproteobacteria bacterium]MBT5790473.1 hypothetical protein [Gammaproteobacteria bacterium]MBT6666848.1 hypothetical protein [Gammaproteobacteria bacterium]MBT7175790.1 hypothetical protein [Gammaproteobacteria bacterium]MBT7797727.1 hypothetical protein [Gammaproteobacteria bacterium]